MFLSGWDSVMLPGHLLVYTPALHVWRVSNPVNILWLPVTAVRLSWVSFLWSHCHTVSSSLFPSLCFGCGGAVSWAVMNQRFLSDAWKLFFFFYNSQQSHSRKNDTDTQACVFFFVSSLKNIVIKLSFGWQNPASCFGAVNMFLPQTAAN